MRKKDLKIILYLFVIVFMQTMLFLVAKLSPFNVHLLTNKIDNNIPFIPTFIYFYISWYVLLIIVPFLLYKKSKNMFKKYVFAVITANIIAFIFYFFYPTTIIRATISNNTFSNFITNIIYLLDTPVRNCLPSMHCILCFFYIFYTKDVKNISTLNKVIIILWNVMIILSTLFVKQHVIIDVISALVISLVIYIISNFIFNKKRD